VIAMIASLGPSPGVVSATAEAASPTSCSPSPPALSSMSVSDLPALMARGKSLPSGYAAVLSDLIARNDCELQRFVGLANITKNSQYFKATIEDLVNEHIVATLSAKWEKFFESCPTKVAKHIAQQEKHEKNMIGLSLVYGEVSFLSLATVFWKFLDLKPGGIFYDIGSGCGRAVIAASLLHNFKRCHGVECLEKLHNAALGVLTTYNQSRSIEEQKAHVVEFTHGDLREFDWTDGDVVFANSTCFDEELMRSLTALAEKLRKGAYVITLTKSLKSPHFDILESKQYTMSWGLATVHTHVKRMDSTLFAPALASMKSLGVALDELADSSSNRV